MPSVMQLPANLTHWLIVSQHHCVMQLPANLTHWLIVSQHYWGKGATREEAMAQLKKAGCRVNRKTYLVVYRCEPDVFIDSLGMVVFTYHGIGYDGKPVESYRQVELINP